MSSISTSLPFSFSMHVSYPSSPSQTVQFLSVMAGVLLGEPWRPKISGVGRSACIGEGNTSVEVPSSPLTGSSLQLTALLSKRQTWGVKGRQMGRQLREEISKLDTTSSYILTTYMQSSVERTVIKNKLARSKLILYFHLIRLKSRAGWGEFINPLRAFVLFCIKRCRSACSSLQPEHSVWILSNHSTAFSSTTTSCKQLLNLFCSAETKIDDFWPELRAVWEL